MKYGKVQPASQVTVKATTPVTVTEIDSGTLYTNEGATAQIVFNLPTASANLMYTFYVQDADGIKINANTGDTIRIYSEVSAAAGFASSTTVGSSVILTAINATEWVATYALGTWTVT